MPSDSEPRTEAGRALLVDLDAVGALDGATGDNRPYVTTSILAIEAEAARLAIESVAERVREVDFGTCYHDVTMVERAAVLALLSTKEEGS